MCLKKAVVQRKQKTKYIGLQLRQSIKLDHLYMKAAFNGLRYSKENKKYDLVAKILE